MHVKWATPTTLPTGATDCCRSLSYFFLPCMNSERGPDRPHATFLSTPTSLQQRIEEKKSNDGESEII